MRPGEYRKSRRIAVVIHKREIYGRLQLTSALVRRYSNLTRIAPSSAFGTQQTVADWRMSASLIGHLGSSAFQTIHHHSVDVARGLVLLFGIGTRALVWGFLCQGVRQGGEAFLRRFLGSISKPVSSSQPAHRYVDARRMCTRLAVTPILRHASPLPDHT